MTGSTANTVDLTHVIIVFFLRFGVLVGRVKEAIELGVFGVLLVGAFNNTVGERRSVRVYVQDGRAQR